MSDKKINFDYLDNGNPYSFTDTEIDAELLNPATVFHPIQISLHEKERLIQLSNERRAVIERSLVFNNENDNLKLKLAGKQRQLRASMLNAIKEFEILSKNGEIDFLEDHQNMKKFKKEYLQNRKLYTESEFWYRVNNFHNGLK